MNKLVIIIPNLKMKMPTSQGRMGSNQGFPGDTMVKNPAANAGDILTHLLLQVQSMGWGELLEEEMTTLFSILAWKIPWTEEPGGLKSMWSCTVGHD